MSSDSTPSLGLTVTSLADGTSIIERSLPSEFFDELDENLLVVTRHEYSKTAPIEFYSRTLDGRKKLGVPLSLCENGVGVEDGNRMVSLLPYSFISAPAGMVELQMTVRRTSKSKFVRVIDRVLFFPVARLRAPCHVLLHRAGERNDSPAARDACCKVL